MSSVTTNNADDSDNKQSKKRISAVDFAPVKVLLDSRLQGHSLEVAKRTLVDGESYGEVATAFGMSRQAVLISAKKVLDTLKLYREAQFAENLALQLQKSSAKKKKTTK